VATPPQESDQLLAERLQGGGERIVHRPEEGGELFDTATTPVKKRMLIIVNPYASTVSDNLRSLVVHALQGRYEVDAVDTEARGHATELCREAAHEGYDVVVAFGGDGTVNEAANGLLGSDTPLTCLPGGSANVFGKMLGIPGDLVDATEHLLDMADDWRVHRVDLGVVNGRCFTFASGLGLDASVVQRVDAKPRLKARWGPWFFTWVAVTTFTRRYLVHPPRLTAQLPDRPAPEEAGAEDSFGPKEPGAKDAGGLRRRLFRGKAPDAKAPGLLRRRLFPLLPRRRHGGPNAGGPVEGVTAIVQSGSPFTYFGNRPIEVAEEAKLDSGTLAACVLRRAKPIDMPFIAFRAFSKRARLARHRQITTLPPTTELTVRTADGRPLPLQVDGDYIGEVEEARYSILPKALAVAA
jgi:diacylglycerol kinase family enzyme